MFAMSDLPIINFPFTDYIGQINSFGITNVGYEDVTLDGEIYTSMVMVTVMLIYIVKFMIPMVILANVEMKIITIR